MILIPYRSAYAAFRTTRVRLHARPAPSRAAAPEDEARKAVPPPLSHRHLIPQSRVLSADGGRCEFAADARQASIWQHDLVVSRR